MTEVGTVEGFRAYLLVTYGTDYEVPTEVLSALLGRARAYIGGERSIYRLAARWLREPPGTTTGAPLPRDAR